MLHLAHIAAVFLVVPAPALGTAAPAPARAAPRVPAGEGAASARAIGHYLRARLALQANDLPAALRELRLALPHEPSSPVLRTTYAEVLARSGELPQAEREARAAVALGPAGSAGIDAHLVLGKVLAARGHPAEALVELELASRGELERLRARRDEAPPDTEPFRTAARLRAEAGDEERSIGVWEGLAELYPGLAAAGLRELGAARASLSPGFAERCARRATALAPRDAEAWKLQAQLAEAAKRDADARAAWQGALAADPDDAEALLATGRLALLSGDERGARELFRRVLAGGGDESASRARVASAWLEARRPAEALRVLGSGDDPRLDYLRGLALGQGRKWPEAAAAFARVRPSSGELFTLARASEAQALSRSGRHGDAVARLRGALADRPGDETLLFALAAVEERAGNIEAAVAQLRALLARNPRHAEALNFLGYLFAERGERLDEAQALVERALELEPRNGAFLDSLGWVLFKKGDAARAASVLERAAKLSGGDATVLEHLGDAYREARRPADAAAAYRSALATPATSEGAAEPAQRAALERKLRDLGARAARPDTSLDR